MDWGKVKFFLGEVGRNFTRNAGMQATAIGTVAVTVVLLGLFLFVRLTLTGVGDRLLKQIEISVYFHTDATPAQENHLRDVLRADQRVTSFTFVPKAEGLKQLRRQTQGSIDVSMLTQNPLPDKFRVRVGDPSEVSAVADALRGEPGVANVVYGKTIVGRLLQLGVVLRRVSIALIVALLCVAAIIISNTIRLTVYARRREIAIMQLVGATATYVRMPFVCEGVLHGLLGSLVALLILGIGKAALWSKLALALPWLELNGTHVALLPIALQLLLVGVAIGALSSWFSIGRYLRT